LKLAHLILLIALASGSALAQEAGGYSAGPTSPPPYQATVTAFKDSPPTTQDRLFAGTRFWRIDPGHYEVQTWWRMRRLRDGKGSEHLFQAEIEIGLTPHIQLDLYENLQLNPGEHLRQEGNQIELRYSVARSYGEIWGNPTFYLEWHPRRDVPDRAEGRLLLGGEIVPHVVGAANFYYEQNVDTGTKEGRDAELGVVTAASYGLLDEHLRLGGEIKIGLDQHGGKKFQPVLEMGPNVLVRVGHFKLTATFFIGLANDDPRVEPMVIAGHAF